MEKNKVSVTINGREYVFKSSEPESYMYHLGLFVDDKISEIVDKFPNISTTDAAVMAALNIADECLKTRDENLKMRDENAVLSEKLAAKIKTETHAAYFNTEPDQEILQEKADSPAKYNARILNNIPKLPSDPYQPKNPHKKDIFIPTPKKSKC